MLVELYRLVDPQAIRLINIVRLGPVNGVTINHRIKVDQISNEEIAQRGKKREFRSRDGF